MKHLILCLLLPTLLFSQWDFRTSSEGRSTEMRYATGKILSKTEYDFEFLVWNNKILGFQFMINSDYFKKDKEYKISLNINFSEVLTLDEFELQDGIINMISFTNENGGKLDIYDVLWKIRHSAGCVVTIVTDNEKLEMFSHPTNSAYAIDFVQGL